MDLCGVDGDVVNKIDKFYLVGCLVIDVMCDSWICVVFFDVEWFGCIVCCMF